MQAPPLARWLIRLAPLHELGLEGLLAITQLLLEEGQERDLLRLRHPQLSDALAIPRYLQTLRDGAPAPRLWAWGPPDTSWHLDTRLTLDLDKGPEWTHGPAALHLSSPPLDAPWPVEIALELRDDRWFPRLPALRMMDQRHRPTNPYSPRAQDNMTLAMAHTPRLNDLLRALADSVAAFGGRFLLDDTLAGAWYRPQCHLHGIYLNHRSPPDEL